ncbi:MAG: hypothetical protein RLZZ74_2243, partial [Cyanobacteriota bacterium]
MSSNLNTSLEHRLASKTSPKKQLEAVEGKFGKEKKDSDLVTIVQQ